MWYAGASRKTTSNVPWETPSQRLRRPISALLLTAVWSWRYGETEENLSLSLEHLIGMLEPVFG